MFRADESRVTPQARRSRLLKMLIANIQKGGTSTHSGYALTLPLIINALEESKTPYQLFAVPGRGYVVKGLANDTEFNKAREGMSSGGKN